MCNCLGCCRSCFVLANVAFLLLQVDYRGNVFVFVIVFLSAIVNCKNCKLSTVKKNCLGYWRFCFVLAINALFLLQVDYQGNVTLLTQGIYMTKCQIDVTHYPFDPQVSISNLPIRQLLDNFHNNTIVWHVLLS